MKLEAVVFATDEEATKAYDSGRCDAYTTDASGLYSERLKMSNPDDHIVLPEIISKEPLGPSVRKDDVDWFQIVQWTHYALLTAEELGVTQANVDEKLKSDNPAIRRLLGVEGSFGQGLGLTNDWAYRIIKACRQLRRDFRAQCGHGLADQDRSRLERAVEQRRPAICPADKVMTQFRPAAVIKKGAVAGLTLRYDSLPQARRDPRRRCRRLFAHDGRG